MTQKTKEYENVKFPYLVISEALKTFHRLLSPKDKKYILKEWHIYYPDVNWKYDNEEQFRSEYARDEITSANLSLHTEQAHIYMTYSRGYKKTTTTITVELSNIDKIEKVFSVFDENYEKYREKPIEAENTPSDGENQPKEPKIPLPNYTLESVLPSTLIDIETIANLEKYIRQRVSQLDTKKTPTSSDIGFLRPTYSLTIVDSQGELKMDTISLFSKDIFDNDTSSISLNYGQVLGSNTLEIAVGFTRHRYSSKLKVSYQGENARDIVESIRIGVRNILNESKTNHSFYHSTWSQSMLILLVSLALLLSLQSFTKNAPYWLPLAIGGFIAFLFMSAVPSLKPYTVFDSKKSRSFTGWNKWLIEAILAALIGWVLFTLLIPNIFSLP